MSVQLSTFAITKILDAMFNNTAVQIAQTYASLHSGNPGGAGASELSGSGYGTRPAVTFGAPTGGVASNSGVVTNPTASGDWPQGTHHGLCDAPTSGNFVAGGSVTTPLTVLNGEVSEWAVGDLVTSFLSGTDYTWGTTTLENIVNALFRNISYVVAQAYASLHTASPGVIGANEYASNGCARFAVSFGAAGAGTIANDAAAQSPLASGDWTEVTHMGFWTLGSGGVFLLSKKLTTARTIRTGKRFRSAIGEITVTPEAG